MDTNGSDYNTRLIRIEGILEVMATHQMTFVDQHGKLLTAQVVLTEQMDQLVGRMDQLAVGMDQLVGGMNQLAGRMDQLAEAQLHTDERLNALITIVDGLIRPKKDQ
jgi:X-X-X-Leu-X-X-Gly heptad repeat protein